MADRDTSLTLLDRARANEPGAWDRLVTLYAPMVRYWCGLAGLESADREDVTQEVFRAALTGLAGFHRDRPGDTFRGWLRGVTRNQITLHFRRTGRQPRGRGGSSAFAQLSELADPHVELPDEDAPREVQRLYHRALEQVRGEFEERTWQMFWQTLVEDKSAAEVAAEFGVTSAAVRKARSRVLHRLREEMGELIA
jgi:RNA polymerase sigma-70 factor (ECF subfamily)